MFSYHKGLFNLLILNRHLLFDLLLWQYVDLLSDDLKRLKYFPIQIEDFFANLECKVQIVLVKIIENCLRQLLKPLGLHRINVV